MAKIVRDRRVALRLLVGGVVLAVSGLAQGADRPEEESPVWVGTGSCAATACHGGRREPLGLKGSEYAFWGEYDPHTRAYSVLYDDRSKRIARNYRRLADLEAARPTEDDLCLRCHVHQGYDSGANRSRAAEFEVADGVGCESCHGPAGRWLVPHSEYGWKGLSETQKADFFGMRPTKDLLARGRICSECHVGTGSADVNHDLIAAGHPRLNFEYGSQLAKVPKHWRIGEDRARHPDYEAKVWVLGQLLAAGSSLDLLESRARRAIPDDSNTPWPEFAEYSCFACHRDVAKSNRGPAEPSSPLKPGSLPWGSWYLPKTGTLAVTLPGVRFEDLGSSLGSIRQEMARPDPDPSLVASRARAASAELARLAGLLNRGQIAPAAIRSMLTTVLEPETPDWDRAAQQYLAIVALDKAMADYDPRYSNPSASAGLERMLRDLDLPVRVESRQATFDSPILYDPERIGQHLRAIRAALPNP